MLELIKVCVENAHSDTPRLQHIEYSKNLLNEICNDLNPFFTDVTAEVSINKTAGMIYETKYTIITTTSWGSIKLIIWVSTIEMKSGYGTDHCILLPELYSGSEKVFGEQSIFEMLSKKAVVAPELPHGDWKPAYKVNNNVLYPVGQPDSYFVIAGENSELYVKISNWFFKLRAFGAYSSIIKLVPVTGGVPLTKEDAKYFINL